MRISLFSRAFLSMLATFQFADIACATVLDFEALATNNALQNTVGTSYQEDGFTLTNSQGLNFFSLGQQNQFFFGSTSLFVDAAPLNTIILRKNDGGAFDAVSFQLATFGLPAGDGLVISAPVRAFGLKENGTTVTTSFLAGGVVGFQTTLFPNTFTDLVQLTWLQERPYHEFDNVIVTPLDTGQTPIPAALPLFATGLACLGYFAHRRKRERAAWS